MKLITLDFEGTLVNFQWKLAQAEKEVINVLVEQGVAKEALEGMNYAAIYNQVQGKEEEWGYPANHLLALVSEIYDQYDLDAASRWEPVSGLHQILNRLKESYQLALVSNIGQKGLTEILPKFNLDKSFAFQVTRNDVKRLKPDPEGLLQVIQEARVEREEVIHIGDSLTDLLTARTAGIKVGIVLGGETQGEVIRREQPELVLDKLSDLPENLFRIGF